MKRLNYEVYETSEFEEWLNLESEKSRLQVRARLANIEHYGHFGIHKSVTNDNSVWELKWDNGRRVYYAYFKEENILVLLGGNKNGQSQDIRKARKILERVIQND